MKVALVVSVRTPGADRFAWRWRPEDGTPGSSDTFKYFFEGRTVCCEDARKAGYECKFSTGDDLAAKSDGVAGARRARRA
jgi:hypothetical protein